MQKKKKKRCKAAENFDLLPAKAKSKMNMNRSRNG